MRREIGHTKRFLERWTADPAFKTLVEMDPHDAVARYGIDIDPEEIRALYDHDYAVRMGKELSPEQVPAPVRHYRQFIDDKLSWRARIRDEGAPSTSPFKEWRARQVARATLQLSTYYNEQIVHAPVAFELNVGCSVGCWFCGVGATGLTERFTYTDANRALWRDTLEAVLNITGEGVKHGFCYWATDPLDNPDYEKFCRDFYEIYGQYPQTTTAIAMKDPDRTLAFHKESFANGGPVNRFSVLSLSILNDIHERFSAEDLVFVELVTQNKEAELVKANAGHFRDNNRKSPSLLDREMKKLRAMVEEKGTDLSEVDDDAPGLLQPGTTACVTGFLFNMVERKVKLISPCYANERWPLGYVVFDEREFTDGADLKLALDSMVREQMSDGVRREEPIRFLPELDYAELEDGFQVTSRTERVELRNPRYADYLKSLGEAIRVGDTTPARLALTSLYRFAVPESRTISTLNEIWKTGALDAEPGLGSHYPEAVGRSDPLGVT